MARRIRDAAEIERQKLARQRFRSLIRSVVYNRIWLNDAEDIQKISMNVKRNVAMLVRRKQQIGILTMAEKAVIRTPHSLRTVEERKQLAKLICGLNCFSKLSPTTRARLVPVIKFLYLGKSRTIIREGNTADTVYFILSGEVEASRKIYDALKGTVTEKVEFIYGPGDCIGDIEMIQGCPRKYTFISTSVVELLVVFGHDFNEILRFDMTKQWHDKLRAIKALGYFDFFNEEQNISLIKLSVLREFDALETIYHEDKGEASYAYFIVSGECMILQSLQLKVREKWGLKSYELAPVSKAMKDKKFDRKSALLELKGEKPVERQNYDIDQLLESDEEQDTELSRIKQALKVMDIKTIEIQCEQRKEVKPTVVQTVSEPSTKRMSLYSKEDELFQMYIESQKSRESEDFEGIEEHSSKTGSFYLNKLDEIDEREQAMNVEVNTEVKTTETVAEETKTEAIVKAEEIKAENETIEMTAEEKPQQATEEYHSLPRKSEALKEATSVESSAPRRVTLGFLSRRNSQSSKTSKKSSGTASERGSLISQVSKDSKIGISKKRHSYKLETRFIDVGSLSYGGIFGLGEKFEDRVIMARTKVQCLLIPRFWLFEKEQNSGRIWQRRRFVIQTGIPSRQQIYHDFCNTRKWQKFKNDLISNILDPNSIANETHKEDIPMMFHIINPIEE